MKTNFSRFLLLILTIAMVLGVVAIPAAAADFATGAHSNAAARLTPEQEDFVKRIDLGFEAIAGGDYDRACEIFGFTGSRSKASFSYGMHFVENSSLTILSATIDKTSVRQGNTAMSAKVRLYVQQDDTELTFGYMAEWPRGVYSMDFLVMMRDEMIFIPKHVLVGEEVTPGLTAIYLPGQTQNSLTIIPSTIYENIPFVYDSPALFMHELWLILQSFNLTSHYAVFWGFGLNGKGTLVPVPEPTTPEPSGLIQAQLPKPGDPIAVMETSMGTIRIRLFPQYAPIAVENFIGLIKEDFYNGRKFHRVIQDFMIQGGAYAPDGTGGMTIFRDEYGNYQTFDNEVVDELWHFRGALSMANAGPMTNSSQFFIVQSSDPPDSDMANQLRRRHGVPEEVIAHYHQYGGTPHLDGFFPFSTHTVFGHVIEGMDVVDAIAGVQTGPMDRPLVEVLIISITLKTA